MQVPSLFTKTVIGLSLLSLSAKSKIGSLHKEMVDLYKLTAEMCTLIYFGCQASFHVSK